MKNFVLAVLIAIVANLTFAAPASAQVEKRGYYGQYQGTTAPSSGGYDNRYNGGGYGYSYSDNIIVPPLLCLIFCGSNKHHAGDLCYTPSGQVLGLNSKKVWYVVPGVTSFGEKGSVTQVTCAEFMSRK